MRCAAPEGASRSAGAWGAAWLALGLVGVACSSGGGNLDVVEGGGGASGGGGGGDDAAGSTGGDSAASACTGGPTSPAPSTGGDGGADRAAVLFMLDGSSSMDDWDTSGVPKLQAIQSAIGAFVADPRSQNLDVALGYFPVLWSPDAAAANCATGAVYDDLAVPLAPLPGNAKAIADTLKYVTSSTGPSTPTEGGIRGALDQCTRYRASHSYESCFVVLVTDGLPNDCSTDVAMFAQMAAAARTTSGVRTFTVGMGAVPDFGAYFAFLNDIATAGGTACDNDGKGDAACQVQGGSDAADALEVIRGKVAALSSGAGVPPDGATAVSGLDAAASCAPSPDR